MFVLYILILDYFVFWPNSYVFRSVCIYDSARRVVFEGYNPLCLFYVVYGLFLWLE